MCLVQYLEVHFLQVGDQLIYYQLLIDDQLMFVWMKKLLIAFEQLKPDLIKHWIYTVQLKFYSYICTIFKIPLRIYLLWLL